MTVKDKLKFLLFLEKNPKHRVMQAHPLTGLFLGLLSWVIGWGLFAYVFPYGFIAVVLSLLVIDVAFLEILHCIFDR